MTLPFELLQAAGGCDVSVDQPTLEQLNKLFGVHSEMKK